MALPAPPTHGRTHPTCFPCGRCLMVTLLGWGLKEATRAGYLKDDILNAPKDCT